MSAWDAFLDVFNKVVAFATGVASLVNPVAGFVSAIAGAITAVKGRRVTEDEARQIQWGGLTRDEFCAMSPAFKLRAHWETLSHEVDKAITHHRREGGMQAGIPELAGAPPSVLNFLRIACRDALKQGKIRKAFKRRRIRQKATRPHFFLAHVLGQTYHKEDHENRAHITDDDQAGASLAVVVVRLSRSSPDDQ